MKHTRILSIAAMLLVLGQTMAQNYQTTTDVIYGQRCFVEVNGVHYSTGDKNGTGAMTWPSRTDAQVCYYLHLPTGYISMTAVLNTKTAASVRLRITDPDTKATIYDNEAATSGSGSSVEVELVKDLNVPADKWYRFEFTSVSPSSINSIVRLQFRRESTSQIVTSTRFMAPSAHLWNRVPSDPMAPTGSSYDWSYQEVMYPSKYLRTATYLETMGVMGGYMGIQYDGEYSSAKNYKVIFSMWDNGDVDSDPNLPEYLRSGNLDSDPNTTIDRFRGERTGIQALYRTGQWWKPDEWVQFLFNTRPEVVNVTVQGSKGQDSTFVYENSIVTAWYKMASDKDWTYIATHRSSGKSYLFSSFYSFIENYADCGEIYTRGYWRNGYMRSAASGKWYPLPGYTFTHNDGGTARTARNDYGHGLTYGTTNTFYMENGGYISTPKDSLGYCGLPSDQSCVDTIDIDAKIARVNQAIQKDAAKQANARLKATGEIYDLSKWELIGFSDQEENDGTYGFAAQAIDGDETSYWRNKWRNGGVLYPHWLALKAPTKVSISDIGVYTDKKSYLYWPAKAVIYTSEDGENWTLATDTIEFARAAKAEAKLNKRLTSQYFKVEFTEGHGVMLFLNELSLSTDVSASRIYEYAASLLDNAGCFDSYPQKDLTDLRRAYNGGNGDIDNIAKAIDALTSSIAPLKYGNVTALVGISTLHRYQLSNRHGYGKLTATADNRLSVGQATVEGAADGTKDNVDVTQLRNNWMLVRAEGYNKYYLYNAGLRRYLDLASEGGLSQTPTEVSVAYASSQRSFTLRSGGKYVSLDPTDAANPVKGVSVADNSCYFELFDNYYLTPTDAEAKYVLAKCVDYAKFDSYVTRLRNILAVEQGVVGSLPDGEERDRLTALYNNGNISIDQRTELYKAVDSAKTVPFAPDKYVYRLESRASGQSSTPYLTAKAAPSTAFEALSEENVAQIWAFPRRDDSFSPTAQGLSLGMIPNSSGQSIATVKAGTRDAGRYYFTENTPGSYTLAASQYTGIALSSLYTSTSGSFGNQNSQFRLRLVEETTVQLNAAGLKGINYSFDVLVPEGLEVYVVDHIDGNTACFLRVYDRLPANTPAVIRGEANQQTTLQIAAPSNIKIEDNMLKGTYFAGNVPTGNGTVYTLSTIDGGRFSKLTTTTLPANDVYLEFDDEVPTGMLTLDFSDEPTGLQELEGRKVAESQSWYTLDGRKINSQSPKGLYIHNGKVVKN